ncbi:hypothetical protein HID58_033604 [Brassica napus]|uniref:Uncharacterized protein n=1 Tax=Brassica napus TaxID=3708 RepID=A0ABQ8C0X3_BRANA|nr:hypothetical protein HID58_033604 [Brassica napus]
MNRSRFIEEDDRNARRDGRSKSTARLQRPVRASPDSAQQMSPGRVFPPVECEYELVMERMLAMQKIREEEAKAKQNKLQGNGVPLIPKTANA